MPGVQLVAVAEPRPAAGIGMPIVEDVASLIDMGIDMAVIAVPTASHEVVATALVQAGVHVLVEKPVASDVAACLRIADAVDRAAVVGCVGHIERYNPALQEMRRRLANGELGDLYQVSTRRQGPFPERIGDVGVVMDLATHDIDLTAWVTQQRYENLSARTAFRSGRENEDLVAAVGQLSGGAVVNHLVNWLSPMKERVTVVTGERGCFVADTLSADLTFYANGLAPIAYDAIASFRGVVQGDVVRYAIAKPEPLVVELEAFRDAVLGRTDKVVGIREATEVVTVAEALLSSSRSLQTVTLRPD
jgi:predicted dehydrogenase